MQHTAQNVYLSGFGHNTLNIFDMAWTLDWRIGVKGDKCKSKHIRILLQTFFHFVSCGKSLKNHNYKTNLFSCFSSSKQICSLQLMFTIQKCDRNKE